MAARGGGTRPGPEKVPLLGEARDGLSALQAGDTSDRDDVLVALADAAARFDIPLPAFAELIDGCAADVRGVSYETSDDLLHYCRCLAAPTGRLSLGVLGTRHPSHAVPMAAAARRAPHPTNHL